MVVREVLHVMKLSPTAVTPVRGSALAAGFDLSRYFIKIHFLKSNWS